MFRYVHVNHVIRQNHETKFKTRNTLDWTKQQMLQSLRRIFLTQRSSLLHRWCLPTSPEYERTCAPVTKACLATEDNCFQRIKPRERKNDKPSRGPIRDPISVFLGD